MNARSLSIFLLLFGASAIGAAAEAPDIVVLKDGGMVRGTIIELVPNTAVEILTLGGEKRRYPMDQVTFAGPTASMPGPQSAPAAAAPSPPASGRTIRFLPATPGLRLHQRTGSGYVHITGYNVSGSGYSASYADLCTPPCDLNLPTGTHLLALSLDGGEPVEASSFLVTDQTTEVKATYVSHSGIRAAGWVIWAATLVAGIALSLNPPKVQTCSDYDPTDCSESTQYLSSRFWVGIGLMIGGTAAGLGMVMGATDAARLEAN